MIASIDGNRAAAVEPAFGMWPGQIQLAAKCQRDEFVEAGIDMVRVEIKRLVEGRDGLFKLASLDQRQPEIAVKPGAGTAGVNAPLVDVDGFSGLPRPHKGDAKIEDGVGEVRRDIEGFSIARNGVINLAEMAQAQPEIIMRLRLARPGLDGAAGDGQRLVKPPQSDQADRHGVQAGPIFGDHLETVADQGQGRLEVSLCHYPASEVGAGLKKIRFQFDRRAEGHDRPVLVTNRRQRHAKKIMQTVPMGKSGEKRCGDADGVCRPAAAKRRGNLVKLLAWRMVRGKPGIGKSGPAGPKAAPGAQIARKARQHLAEPVAGFRQLAAGQRFLRFLQLCLDTRRHRT